MSGSRWMAALGAALFLAACAAPAPLPLVVTEAPLGEPTMARPIAPEARPTVTAPIQAPAASPTLAVIPTLLPDTVPVAVPTFNSADPLRFTFPTPIAFNTPENWRPPVQGVPVSIRPQDHFWFARPIASDSVNWPLGSYRYGSDYFGQMNVHAGIDIDAPRGTPILAAGPGQVIWAGWGLFNFDPRREDDPYGIAVAIRHDYGYKNRNLYTLYAHMEAQNNLYVGQRVETGQVLGWIGVTGNTTGPHVHFEVRVGENGYFSTRNPELWIAPYSGWGVLVGQLLDKAGRPIYSQPIEV
ncbi:MAG: peptidoglycan DD-metalloendopeptidase family protein [Anaerolineales bacterium]|nr:peptidoglycan DD-metalloendopeptidase family protein [Anaerolineales bacterium]